MTHGNLNQVNVRLNWFIVKYFKRQASSKSTGFMHREKVCGSGERSAKYSVTYFEKILL
jgi:hypothetical protein